MNPPPQSDFEITPSVLARYLSGECDHAERERIEKWLVQVPGRRAQLEEMRALWFRASAAPETGDTAPLAARIVAQARAQTEPETQSVGVRRRPYLRAM